jgi:hypothetical protein
MQPQLDGLASRPARLLNHALIFMSNGCEVLVDRVNRAAAHGAAALAPRLSVTGRQPRVQVRLPRHH